MLDRAFAARRNVEARLNILRPRYYALRDTWLAVQGWVNNLEAEIPSGFENYRDFGGDDEEVAQAIFQKLQPKADEIDREMRQSQNKLNTINEFIKQYSVSANFHLSQTGSEL